MKPFNELFNKPEFVDRYSNNKEQAVDVIIPIINTNGLFKRNLLSFYKEIPIRNLFIGDGGCDDDSLLILRDFPRVKIIDCREDKTLGYCIKRLIELVDTEFFIYLHSDAFLPAGWFDSMRVHTGEFDWFECRAYPTILAVYIDHYEDTAKRAFSGSQMGRSALLKNAVIRIEDDYLYRNEDIVIRELVEKQGGRYGRVKDTFYYHEQILNPDTIESINIKKKYDREKETRMLIWQIKGILKYTKLKPYLLKILVACFIRLIKTRLRND
jgi:hypothetical protein